MGYLADDVYYQPEKFDLVPVAELELYEPNWSFDTVVVWEHASGQLYWAHDSGCSCPSPFEDYTSLDQLTKLSSDNYAELREFVKDSYNAAERASFLRKVRRALAG